MYKIYDGSKQYHQAFPLSKIKLLLGTLIYEYVTHSIIFDKVLHLQETMNNNKVVARRLAKNTYYELRFITGF